MIAVLILKIAKGLSLAWECAKSKGGIVTDYGWSCASDLNGNIYVTDYFLDSSLVFDSSMFNNSNTYFNIPIL